MRKIKQITVTPEMKVEELQQKFKKEFGLTLRVFQNLHLVAPNKALNELTENGATIIIDQNNTIEEVCDMFVKTYRLKVQIADRKDTKLLNKERKLKERNILQDIINKTKNF